MAASATDSTASEPTSAQTAINSAGWVIYTLSAISALLMVFLVPPFQAPDEQQHFFHSYSLASGALVPERRGEVVGSVLPSSLAEAADALLRSRALHTARPFYRYGLDVYAREHARTLDPGRREFVAFSDSSLVGPVAYLPQTVGILVGRAFNAAPIDLLYCARIGNLLAGFLLVGLALRALGDRLSWAHCLVGLPMVQAEFASACPDATMIVCGLIVATALASRNSKPTSEFWTSISVLVAALVLVSTKAVYIGVPALAAIVLAYRGTKIGRLRQALIFGGVMMGLAGLLALAWGDWAAHFAVLTHPIVRGSAPVDQAAQTAFVRSHPLGFIGIVAVTTVKLSVFYVTSTLGILGWLTVLMWKGAYFAALVALALAFTQPQPRSAMEPVWLRLLAIGALLGTYALIELALYIRWSAVGAPLVDGVQGRYFLPVLFLLGLAQTPIMSRFLNERARTISILSLLTAAMLSAQYAVYADFYGRLAVR